MKLRLNAASGTDRMQVMHVGDGIATGALGCAAVVVWRDAMTTQRFRIERECLQTTVRKHKKRAALLCVLERSVAPPDDQLKLAYAGMLGEHADEMACVGCVVEGGGFQAAAMRSALSAIQLLLGARNFPCRFFTSVAEACAWIAAQTPVIGDDLKEATEELRAFLDAEDSVTLVRRREI